MHDTTTVTAIDVKESLQTLRDGRYACHTEDVLTWKLGDDLARYAAVIERTKPDVIIETGTRYGGSALWFALRGLDVITIDIEPALPLGGWERAGERITLVKGSSTDPAVVALVAEQVAGLRVMVSLDSDHHAPHVAEEIEAYGPMVSAGCYLVVEDGIFDLASDPRDGANGGIGIPTIGGPLVAIERTLVGRPEWERDLDVENMSPLSHHPGGWWRRL